MANIGGFSKGDPAPELGRMAKYLEASTVEHDLLVIKSLWEETMRSTDPVSAHRLLVSRTL